MKRSMLLGAAAAALLLSAGTGWATTTITNLNINFVLNGTTYNCPLVVTQTTDSKRHVTNSILLTAQSDSCEFYGGGTIGLVAETGTTLTNMATISGYDIPATSVHIYNLTVLLKVTGDGKFKSGYTYSVYGSTSGQSGLGPQTYISKGKYTITP